MMLNPAHLLPVVWLLLLLLQVTSTETLLSTQTRGFHWVLASSGQGHAAACRLNELFPTATRDNVPWGEDVMREVVAGLGRQLLLNSSLGLAGCCAPALWCLPGEQGACYTHSLSAHYFNPSHTLTTNVNMSSVYTCVDSAVEEEGVVTGLLSYEYEGEGAQSKVVVAGASYGLDRDAVDVTLNGASCSDVDLCHSVCQACTTSPPGSCPTGSICLGVSSRYSCFPYCAGPEDTGCPCSSSCVLVSIQITQTTYLPIHLCAPAGLSCDNYMPSTSTGLAGADSHLTCHSPSVYSQIFHEGEGDEEWLNDAQEATLSVQNDAVVMAAALPPLRCTADADCFDLDAYTSDTCSEQGVCTYTQKENVTLADSDALGGPEHSEQEVAMASAHSSTFSHIRDRTTPFTYVWFQLSGQEATQASFESDIQRDGTRSPVSDEDDHPVDYFDLPFTFDFFGTALTEVSVNPNGVLSFPPFSHCWGMTSGLACPVYRTSTNTISLWSRDWDPSRDASSSVYTLQQPRVDGDTFDASFIGGVNANAFHVMYSNMLIFDAIPSTPADSNSFSASLYEDGSVRLRFHDTAIEVQQSDVFGMWGGRAASASSPLLSHDSSSTRYHQETLNGSALVGERSGQDVAFCNLATLACMPHACTGAGGSASFTLLGGAPSCLAAAGALQVWCVWAGGVAVSLPTFSPSLDTNHTLVQCPTPSLDIANNSLISLDLRLAVSESQASSPMSAGQKSVFTKYMDSSTGEVVNGHLMVRYFSSLEAGVDGEECGCDAISSSALSAHCDTCLVCGAAAGAEAPSESMRDCHGDCHGTAYEDSCGTCAGGKTSQHPISSCDFPDDDSGEDEMSNISKTILFIVLMICMTFMFTACLRIIRTSVSIQEQEQEALRQVQQLHLHAGIGGQRPAAPLRRGNGLSRFEIDSLGEDAFALIKCSAGGGGGGGDGKEEEEEEDVETGGHSSSSVYGARDTMANLECAICLGDFSESSVCRQLPCEHVFHKGCIDEWFVLSVKCPMCKRNIRDIILGEEVVSPRRRLESSGGGGEGGAEDTDDNTDERNQTSSTSSSSVDRTSSDDGSDGGVENPLIVSLEMTSRHI